MIPYSAGRYYDLFLMLWLSPHNDYDWMSVALWLWRNAVWTAGDIPLSPWGGPKPVKNRK